MPALLILQLAFGLMAPRCGWLTESTPRSTRSSSPRVRVKSDLDFTTLSAAGNVRPRALWSDGATMWASDSEDRKLYAYNMPKSALLKEVQVDGARVDTFAPERSAAHLNVARSTTTVTLTAQAAFSDSAVTIEPSDANTATPAHDVSLSLGDNPVTITVTNGTDTRSYTVTIRRVDAAALNAEAKLSSLGVTQGNVSGFDSNRRSHRIGVARDVSTTTLQAVPLSSAASVTISPADADLSTDGHQLALSPGSNRAEVRVWSTDGRQFRLYKLDVHRSDAPPSAALASLELDGVMLRRDLPRSGTGFEQGVTGYRAYTPNTVTSTTVTASPVEAGATVTFTPADADTDTDGHQVSVPVGQTSITATVVNGISTRVYEVNVTGVNAATLSSDATLTSLTASGVDFGTFSAATASYYVHVPNTVVSTTIAPTPADAAAFVTITPADADSDTDGHQVSVPVGQQTDITVDVLSSDGSTSSTYVLEIVSVDAAELSDDATLSSLSISDLCCGAVDLQHFDSATTTYDAHMTVTGGDTRPIPMNVVAVTTEPAATVVITPHDVAASRDGHQIALGIGYTEVVIAVKSSDGTTQQDYRVRVTRAVPSGGWTMPGWGAPAARHGTTANRLGATSNPQGIWSDGITMWVANDDPTRNKVQCVAGMMNAYKLPTRQYLPWTSFGGNNWKWIPCDPAGIWSDGDIVWIVDTYFKRIDARELRTGDWMDSLRIDNLERHGNAHPRGIWSDGTILWVADSADDKIYAYDLVLGERRPAHDIDTLSAAGNNNPNGLWSDGTTLWVVDATDLQVYAYDLRSGARKSGVELPSSTAAQPRQHRATRLVVRRADDVGVRCRRAPPLLRCAVYLARVVAHALRNRLHRLSSGRHPVLDAVAAHGAGDNGERGDGRFRRRGRNHTRRHRHRNTGPPGEPVDRRQRHHRHGHSRRALDCVPRVAARHRRGNVDRRRHAEQPGAHRSGFRDIPGGTQVVPGDAGGSRRQQHDTDRFGCCRGHGAHHQTRRRRSRHRRPPDQSEARRDQYHRRGAVL